MTAALVSLFPNRDFVTDNMCVHNVYARNSVNFLPIQGRGKNGLLKVTHQVHVFFSGWKGSGGPLNLGVRWEARREFFIDGGSSYRGVL